MKPFYKYLAGVATITLLSFIPGSRAVAGVPLQILSFSAQQSDKDALLDWKTENEGSTDYFEVERSTDALVFVSIGRLNARNTSGIHTYRLRDAHVQGANKSLYYRLKQVDMDRNITYLPVVKLSFEQTENTVSLFPNPVIRQATLQIALIRSGQVQLQITDNMGRLLRQSSYQLAGGTTSLPFDAGGLPRGTYYAEFRGTAFNRVIRFVKQ
jgi:hypothetical protein